MQKNLDSKTKEIFLNNLDQSVKFESNGVFLSAPLTQKYVCKDRMNISLHNQHFKDYILELEPEIEAQPYRADQQTNGIKLFQIYFIYLATSTD